MSHSHTAKPPQHISTTRLTVRLAIYLRSSPQSFLTPGASVQYASISISHQHQARLLHRLSEPMSRGPIRKRQSAFPASKKEYRKLEPK